VAQHAVTSVLRAAKIEGSPEFRASLAGMESPRFILKKKKKKGTIDRKRNPTQKRNKNKTKTNKQTKTKQKQTESFLNEPGISSLPLLSLFTNCLLI
jgi:hypothetical protein